MVASVPEETKRTRSTGVRADDLLGELDLGLGRRAVRRAAGDRVAYGGLTSGWAWPSSIGPHEQTRST